MNAELYDKMQWLLSFLGRITKNMNNTVEKDSRIGINDLCGRVGIYFGLFGFGKLLGISHFKQQHFQSHECKNSKQSMVKGN